ncbi:putative lipoxygenase -like proteiny domain-containing protein 1-like [Capsicum annuum]|uniref:PLAT domain-containing protein n=1 Tax=Capsicum annuum TaxID=4072 RepID=A0A2G2Z5G7_CAPAN|nr:PLAT domain-containing protein 3 [Capsicum annuum]KAF3639508.1 putative lipoxygenase -like proteiny domain-containing protein 1-like [Capsicum annuum]PHT77250.1 hypothetical protein T459_20772 [Capsicum annuum]
MGVAAAQVNHFWFYLFILFSSIAVSSISGSEDDCVYTIFIRTSKKIKAGTDSIISLTLYDAEGYGIRINNLEAWGGLMGPGYNYYERGNLDIFSGRGPCLSGPVCKMNLTSDGTGPGHGWYPNYVEVTVTGVHLECNQQNFEVEQWIATDHSPYELTFIKDLCKKKMFDKNLPVSDNDSKNIPKVAAT